MRTVGVRDLIEHVAEILRHVREDGQTYEVTYRGRVIARVIPIGRPVLESGDQSFWEEWRELSREISAGWPEDVSALDAIRSDRLAISA